MPQTSSLVPDNMEIVPLFKVPYEKWHTFVQNCDECWLFHHSAFQDLDDPNSQSFAIIEQERLVGGCILYVNRSGIGKVLGGRYGPAGLAVLPSFSRRAYPLVNAHLKMLARRHGCHAVQMGLPILAPAYRSSEYLKSHLYSLGFNNTLRWGLRTTYVPSYTTVIDLAFTLNNIYSGFSESVRRNCARASKFPFDTEFLQGYVTDSQWAAFVRNHQATMKRGQAQSLPAKTIDKLRALVGQRYAALTNINIAGKTVASLLLLTYKNCAVYFASGVQPEVFKEGFASQLHWTAVRELRERGYERYEVGQFYPTLIGTKLGQLGEFKRRFGGIKCPVLAGELVTQEMRMLCLDIGPAYARRFAKDVLNIAHGN